MATGADGLRQFKPGFPLSVFVDCLWIHEGYCAPHARERVLPAGTMELIFAVGPDGRAISSVAGPQSECVELDTSRPFTALGVHFRPGGGFPFVGVPGGELHNRRVTLDTLWGTEAARTSDRVWEAANTEQRFRILEETLRNRARGRFDRHPAVAYALQSIERSHGARQLRDLTEQIGMSPRRFFEVFRREVGLSPKVFCRIRRFAAVLRRIEYSTDVNWADVAASCGYFDQAHFNHDFRAFSGLSPSAYLRHRTSRTHVASGAWQGQD